MMNEVREYVKKVLNADLENCGGLTLRVDTARNSKGYFFNLADINTVLQEMGYKTMYEPSDFFIKVVLASPCVCR